MNVRDKYVEAVKVNYKRRWHMWADRNRKKELAEVVRVSTYTVNKLNTTEYVIVEVLGKLCHTL